MSLAYNDCTLVPRRTTAANAEIMEEINMSRAPEFEGPLPRTESDLLRRRTDSSLQDKLRLLWGSGLGGEGDFALSEASDKLGELPREDSFEMAQFAGALHDLMEEQRYSEAAAGNSLVTVKDEGPTTYENRSLPQSSPNAFGINVNAEGRPIQGGQSSMLSHLVQPVQQESPVVASSSAGVARHGASHSSDAITLDTGGLPPKFLEFIAPHMWPGGDGKTLLSNGSTPGCGSPQFMQREYLASNDMTVKSPTMQYQITQQSQPLTAPPQSPNCFPCNEAQPPMYGHNTMQQATNVAPPLFASTPLQQGNNVPPAMFGSNTLQQGIGCQTDVLCTSPAYMQHPHQGGTSAGLQGYNQPDPCSTPTIGLNGALVYSDVFSGVAQPQHASLSSSTGFATSTPRFQGQDGSFYQGNVSGLGGMNLEGNNAVYTPGIQGQVPGNLAGWQQAAHTDCQQNGQFQYNNEGCINQNPVQVLSPVPGSAPQSPTVPHGAHSLNLSGYQGGLCGSLMETKPSVQVAPFDKIGALHDGLHASPVQGNHSMMDAPHSNMLSHEDTRSAPDLPTVGLDGCMSPLGHRVHRSCRLPNDPIDGISECPRKVLRRNTAGEGEPGDGGFADCLGPVDVCNLDHMAAVDDQCSRNLPDGDAVENIEPEILMAWPNVSVGDGLAALQEGVESDQDLTQIASRVMPGPRDEAMEAELQNVNFGLRVERAEKKIEQHDQCMRHIDEQIASGTLNREKAKVLRRRAYNRREAAASRARKDKELQQTVIQKQRLEKVEHQLRTLLVSPAPLSPTGTTMAGSGLSLRRSCSGSNIKGLE